MKIEFRQIEPHPLLRSHIDKMWVFETSGKLPSDDLKLVVPNGAVKLTIFSVNGITASIDGRDVTSAQGTMNVTGLVDVPVNLDAERDVTTETIGIEFNPGSAYRFFDLPLGALHNRIYALDDLLGKTGKALQDQVAQAGTVRAKIALVQQYLIGRLQQHPGDLIFEYCISRILDSRGRIPVKELERKTGYSSRWLNMKFMERIGTSPKNLSSVIRFSDCYRTLISALKDDRSRHDYYDHYYDQSHFIRNFKHYTGHLPSALERKMNEFGRKFYQA